VLQIGRSLVRFQMVSLEFFIGIKSFRSHYGPGVDSAYDRNEYQGYFLGVKSGRCVRLTTLPPSCAIVTLSRNLTFLEPSGHFQPVMGLIYLKLRLLKWSIKIHRCVVNTVVVWLHILGPYWCLYVVLFGSRQLTSGSVGE